MDSANNGNMFFWFFPAEENPETAPVVIWLQVSSNTQIYANKCSLMIYTHTNTKINIYIVYIYIMYSNSAHVVNLASFKSHII